MAEYPYLNPPRYERFLVFFIPHPQGVILMNFFKFFKVFVRLIIYNNREKLQKWSYDVDICKFGFRVKSSLFKT
jgi:hypothetical protein